MDAFTNLGGLERPKDDRDFQLGMIQQPVPRPAFFLPDLAWFTRNWQAQTPTCGAHADSHWKAVMDRAANPKVAPHYTPRFNWIEIKLLDGIAPENGTDMRSIFKATQNNGMLDFALLGNDVALPLAAYTDPSVITPEMVANASPKTIGAYAFGNTDFDSLCQHIYQNKAVILLIKVDDGFWGTQNPTFTQPLYGHFVVADGYDPVQGIRIIDSADENFGIKYIAPQYVTSTFIIESGTAVNILPSVKQALTSGQILLAQQILEDMKRILLLDQKILG